jgi:hypothetical protein
MSNIIRPDERVLDYIQRSSSAPVQPSTTGTSLVKDIRTANPSPRPADRNDSRSIVKS